MYPGFAAQATADKCTAAAALFTEIAMDEGGHAAAYTLALKSLTNPKVKVPTPQTVDPVVITASTPACPGTLTQDNLLAAMHGEAFAYAKYTAYALQAARPSASASASASASSSASSSATPATTSTASDLSSGDSTPLLALLICLALGGLGLVAVEAQRRRIRS